MDIIDEFEKWASTKSTYFSDQGFEYEIVSSPKDISKPSARVDFDNDVCLGRIVVWATGECELEVLDIFTEKTKLYKYIENLDPSLFDSAFGELFKLMKS